MDAVKDKEAIRKICVALGERLDKEFVVWEFEETRSGLSMTTVYKLPKKTGFGLEDPIITLYFGWGVVMSDFRILFLGTLSQALNRKFGLREIIAKRVLSELESICIAQECFDRFVKC